METLTLLGFGLLLGVRHASDPDHVVAVAAIAGRYKRVWPAALVGALWGLGHSLTNGVVGGLIMAFNLTVPPRVGLSLEFVVGIALTVVGVLNLIGRGGFLTSSVGRGELPKGNLLQCPSRGHDCLLRRTADPPSIVRGKHRCCTVSGNSAESLPIA